MNSIESTLRMCIYILGGRKEERMGKRFHVCWKIIQPQSMETWYNGITQPKYAYSVADSHTQCKHTSQYKQKSIFLIEIEFLAIVLWWFWEGGEFSDIQEVRVLRAGPMLSFWIDFRLENPGKYIERYKIRQMCIIMPRKGLLLWVQTIYVNIDLH